MMSVIVRMFDTAVTMPVAVVVRLFVMEAQKIYSVIVAFGVRTIVCTWNFVVRDL